MISRVIGSLRERRSRGAGGSAEAVVVEDELWAVIEVLLPKFESPGAAE
ncbi:hypothetical protein OG206_00900 [Streptomyces sp. NBC_01341]|nr:hypothetical protein OG206_00900 [Streptomyces sp. NBC_01341]